MTKRTETIEKMLIEYIDKEELVIADYNPRFIGEKDRKALKVSLERFGFVNPLVVNRHPERFNIVVGGAQRLSIALEVASIKEVPCVIVNLDLDQEKELNLRLNKNQGEFDYDKLKSFFDQEFLLTVGFNEQELKIDDDAEDAITKEMNKYDNTNAEYPIVPKFSESYAYVVIFTENDIDQTFLENFFGLEKQQCYKKTNTVALGRVVPFAKFATIIDRLTNNEA